MRKLCHLFSYLYSTTFKQWIESCQCIQPVLSNEVKTFSVMKTTRTLNLLPTNDSVFNVIVCWLYYIVHVYTKGTTTNKITTTNSMIQLFTTKNTHDTYLIINLKWLMHFFYFIAKTCILKTILCHINVLNRYNL